MTDASRIDSPNRMYNRLFWLDWISRLWSIGFGLWSLVLIYRTVLNCLPGAHVTLTLPAVQDYPPHSGSLYYSRIRIRAAGTSVTFTQATMTVAHLPIWSAITLGLGQVFAAATSAGIAWCLFVLVRKLRENEPFAASTGRALVAAGLILGIGSTLSTVATASAQIGLSVAYIPKYGQLTLAGAPPFIEFAPLFFAGMLFALAGVFRYGERLERDRAQLRRDTDGLV